MLRRGEWQRSKVVATVLLWGALPIGDAAAQVGSRPRTPSPCAADGICRPKRETWGHYGTRWRPWPGDALAKGPTPAELEDEEEAEVLPPFERPQPIEEDLRGPAKPPTAAREDQETGDEAAGEPALDPNAIPGLDPLPEFDPAPGGEPAPGVDVAPGVDPGLGLPGVDPEPAIDEGLPAFDPQGDLMPPPSKDDAPPALPEVLQQLSRSQPALPPVPQSKPRSRLPIVRANATRSDRIVLINPAAAVVDQHANRARHAIYVEATDQGPQ